MIDLRSDTVTQPTAAMRAAMADAEVGDDVYGEDPTVSRLEELGAAMLGKQAALFFPTGTMANQTAIHLHATPGDEALVESLAHSHDWELGGAAALSGVQLRPVRGERGVIQPETLQAMLRQRSEIESRVALLIVENTHNMAGGSVVPLEVLDESAALARDAGARVHLDGARLFNASVACGVTASRLAAAFDTVMISLSKGLSAPVGSLLAGDAATIRQARRVRKMLGGGMRQAGVIAAAGIVALETGVDRLVEDHAAAALLAESLLATGKARLAYGPVESNIVVLDVAPQPLVGLIDRARQAGIACGSTAAGYLRLVTHLDVGPDDIDQAAATLARLLTS